MYAFSDINIPTVWKDSFSEHEKHTIIENLFTFYNDKYKMEKCIPMIKNPFNIIPKYTTDYIKNFYVVNIVFFTRMSRFMSNISIDLMRLIYSYFTEVPENFIATKLKYIVKMKPKKFFMIDDFLKQLRMNPSLAFRFKVSRLNMNFPTSINTLQKITVILR